jgi:hypothetical protein
VRVLQLLQHCLNLETEVGQKESNVIRLFLEEHVAGPIDARGDR